MATLDIFDVEHGACAVLTADTGAHMMIDCGRNVSTGWSPASELKSLGVNRLELLAVTNYDEDHVDGLPELRREVQVQMLWRSKNVDLDKVRELKSEDGMGEGIAALVSMAKTYTGPPADVDFGQIKRSMFFNPAGSFDDENNLSAIIVLEIYGKKIIFTGDMERAGFDLILKDVNFRNSVMSADVLIAPHHGRESAVHEEFLEIVRPCWTIISDKGYMYDTQATVPIYRRFCRGGIFRENERQVLTTRKDGTIRLWFEPDAWGAT